MPNIKHTKELLRDMPTEFTAMIRGVHGTGKTEVTRQLCAEADGWNLKCIELQGSQLSDVGDLIGLQKIKVIKDEFGVEHEETIWVPPYWFPKDGKPFCLFLDEINRAAPPIKRAMMQIGNDHKLLNFVLPEGTRVVCAVNPDGAGNYDVEEFDDAENDRYWHIEFTPDVEEALDYWRSQNINSCVIDYCDQNRSDVDPYTVGREGKMDTRASGSNASGRVNPAKQSRRSWFRLAKCIDAKLEKNPNAFNGKSGLDCLEMLASGWVGPSIASNFRSFYAQHGTGLTPAAIIEALDFKKLAKQLNAMPLMETVRLGISVCNFLHEKEDLFVENRKATDYAKTAAANFLSFLNAIKPEVAAQINSQGVEKFRKDKSAKWVGILTHINNDLCEKFLDLADLDI